MGPRSLPPAALTRPHRSDFFLSASRLHFVFVALVHEGGKELREQGATHKKNASLSDLFAAVKICASLL